MRERFDVIVAGAGAAGLACAADLLSAGKKVLVLEARDRVGGRAWSRTASDGVTVLEAGAEFIHGNPGVLMRLMDEMGLPFYDVLDKRFFFRDGRLSEDRNFWKELKKIMDKIPEKNDGSVENFADHLKASKKNKDIFRSFVEGFHAADLSLMSRKGLKHTEQTDDDDLNGSAMFRPLRGYGNFLAHFLEARPALKEALHLNSVIKKIRPQRRPEVEIFSTVTGELHSYSAEWLVLTLPIGVLKDPGLQWDPGMPAKLQRALKSVHMGNIQKVTFTFKSRFWEDLTGEPPAFFHTGPERYFPTWWTLLPLRTPHLVAWQGGPKALEMSFWPEERKIGEALKTLAGLTSRSPSFLEAQLEMILAHDWTRDPFSRGAYSYIGVDGFQRSRQLAHIFESNIIVAGEGTVAGPDRGTVHGALLSGLRAARQILKD